MAISILLADDDQDDLALFVEAIKEIDGSVIYHCTNNGQEAIDLLPTLDKQPNIIFLDINMPIMDGWHCLQELKLSEKYKHIPVIMFSTSSYQKEVDLAFEKGALCFFIKPFDYMEFRDNLTIVLQNLQNGTLGNLIESSKNLRFM